MYKILLVEDDADIREVIRDYFDAKSEGNGLGLSIVNSIVQSHNFKLNITLNNSIITFTINLHK